MPCLTVERPKPAFTLEIKSAPFSILSSPVTSLKGKALLSIKTARSLHASFIERASAFSGRSKSLSCFIVPSKEKRSTRTLPPASMGKSLFSIHWGKRDVGKILLKLFSGIKGLLTFKSKCGFELSLRSIFELAASEKSRALSRKDGICKILSE